MTLKFFMFQKMISKPVQEVGKLYPEDLGEKVITRDDIEFIIFMKKKKDDNWERKDSKKGQ